MFKKYLIPITISLGLSTNLFCMEKEIDNNYYHILFGKFSFSPQIDLSAIMDPALEEETKDKRHFNSFKIAADLGHANAQYHLAYLYFDGQGVEKNLHLSYEYLKLGEKNSLMCEIELQNEFLILHYILLVKMEIDMLKDDKPVSFNFLNNIQSEIINKQNIITNKI